MRFFQRFLILFALATIFSGTSCGKVKITDPSNPGFDPDKFSFNDYKNREELISVYKKLFPLGIKKEFVDRVLVEAGAKSSQSRNFKQIWHYNRPRSWQNIEAQQFDVVIYDDNLKLLNIYVNALEPPVHPDSVTLEDVRKEYISGVRK